MQHSVKEIGKRYSKLSLKRNNKVLFKYDNFIKYANDNKKKHNLIKNGNDFFVSTWYSDELIDDYRKTF